MIRVFSNTNDLMRAAAELFVERAKWAIQSRAQFNVALAGGGTPKAAYELLAGAAFRDRVNWQHVHVFWGDERCVPPDDTRSNYGMTRGALLENVPIPAANVHRIHGELLPADAALEYEANLAAHFGDRLPTFDLVLLGLGTDGHTASLFPGTPVVHEVRRRVMEVSVPESDLWRITLTAPVLAAASLIAFLVTGADKADVLRDVLFGACVPDRFPAQLLRPASSVTTWLVDQSAASELPDSVRS